MGKSKTPRSRRSSRPNAQNNAEELNPRQARFEQYYRNGGPDFPAGNAYKSALAAGYSATTAKAKSHLLARRANVKTAEALTLLGRDGFSQALKLIALSEAQLVKWNASDEDWDTFDDGHLQLEAVKEINRLLDEYPAPKEPNTNDAPIQIIFPANFGSVAVKAEATNGEGNGGKKTS